MASLSTNAFDINSFYAGAFDFGINPTFQPAFSDGAFGRNTAFSDGAFAFAATPPFQPAYSDEAFGRNTAFSDQAFAFASIPPTPSGRPSRKGMGGYSPTYEDERLRKIEQQNEDDLQIVMLLTEFLTRIQ